MDLSSLWYLVFCPFYRFLDNRLFATCSDDTTIALWDLRKLNTKVCTLHGHTSWVKNIEYDTNTRLLVTSGFDGNVIIWDTNRYTGGVFPLMHELWEDRTLLNVNSRMKTHCSEWKLSKFFNTIIVIIHQPTVTVTNLNCHSTVKTKELKGIYLEWAWDSKKVILKSWKLAELTWNASADFQSLFKVHLNWCTKITSELVPGKEGVFITHFICLWT